MVVVDLVIRVEVFAISNSLRFVGQSNTFSTVRLQMKKKNCTYFNEILTEMLVYQSY